MARTADIKVTLADGAVARVRVEAPEGVADAPGTPFGMTYEPAPVVALVDDGLAEDIARDLASLGRSVASVSCEARELEGPDVAEAMSALGVTQAHLLAGGAGARAARSLAEKSPHRALSVACREEGEDASAFVRRAARAMDEAEPSRRHRPLVVFEDGTAHVAPRVEGVLVRPATLADEPAILAMYDHLLDSCDVPGRETCGWLRGFWPLPDDVSRRLHEGVTWVAVDVGEGEADPRRESDASDAGPAVLGAMSLDGDFGLPGAEPDWEPLGPGEFLTCHLLATDPVARGRGVATALLAEYAREAIARGCKALRINTSPESLSNRLYRELGFTLHAPQWFPYEGLPITGWTNVYELRLDGPAEGGEPAAPSMAVAADEPVASCGFAAACDPAAPREPAAATEGSSARTLGDIDFFGDDALRQRLVRASARLLIGGAALAVALSVVTGTGVIEEMRALPGDWGAALWPLAMAALSVAALPVHELVHALFMRVLGGPGTRVSFGYQAGMLYAGCPGLVLSKPRFVAVLLAPTVLVTAALLGLGLVLGYPFMTLWAAVLHLSGCSGDILAAGAILRERACTHCRDTERGVELLCERVG
ncbi:MULTISPECIES: GNAT family N-acetyltransferase [unclassified Collinsella]|uniref:GNAT family N-acetyltransferase n=1 Tax=unclassified Collinsella TaxID=2637548 RepID=UPI00319DECF2